MFNKDFSNLDFNTLDTLTWGYRYNSLPLRARIIRIGSNMETKLIETLLNISNSCFIWIKFKSSLIQKTFNNGFYNIT